MNFQRFLSLLAELPHKLTRRGFARNVATVATGSGAAIAINLLSAPILTRVYTPGEFGAFAAFLSISSILAVGASGRYELAVVLADTTEEARRLVLLCLGLSAAVAAGLFVAIPSLAPWLSGSVQLSRSLLWLIPPFVLLLSAGQALNNWLNWSKNYVVLGSGRVLRNTSAAGTQIGLSFLGFGSVGLAAGRILGESSFGLLAAVRYVRESTFGSEDIQWGELKALFTKHVRFPLYTLPSSLVNKTNSELPEILLLSLFDPRAAGLYALTRRAVDRPFGFLSNSVKEVFYRRFAESQRDDGDLEGVLTTATLAMAAIVVPPIILLMRVAPDLVAWVFGEEWREAGDYIRVLGPAIAVHLVVRSTSLSMYVMEKQDVVLWWTLTFLVLSTCGLVLGAHLGGPLTAVALLAGVRVAMYLIYYFANLYYARHAGNIA